MAIEVPSNIVKSCPDHVSREQNRRTRLFIYEINDGRNGNTAADGRCHESPFHSELGPAKLCNMGNDDPFVPERHLEEPVASALWQWFDADPDEARCFEARS